MNICSSDHDTCTRYHIHCADCDIRVQAAAIGKNGHTYCGHCYSIRARSSMGLELHWYWFGTFDQKDAIYRFYAGSDEFLT
jgi:hypothetical protein